MKSKNPFYALLLISAVLFSITACSYCVMMLTRTAEADHASPGAAGGPVQFFDSYGVTLLAGLIAAMAIFTVAAIATDNYRTRRATDRDRKQPDSDSS